LGNWRKRAKEHPIPEMKIGNEVGRNLQIIQVELKKKRKNQKRRRIQTSMYAKEGSPRCSAETAEVHFVIRSCGEVSTTST
jgi:hypothetical protein